jgi:xylulokinase
MTAKYALGLDSSTQSLTAFLVDAEKLEIYAELSLNFDQYFPQYKTENGTLKHVDSQIVHAPPQLWVEALDQLFAKMKAENWPLDQIEVIAGSGQQHGTVYLNQSARAVLAKLDPNSSLVDQLKGIYSRETSPIWMDSSTKEDCDALTESLGAKELAASTGSFAYERFSGPQIRKFYREDPNAYAATDAICLVSSFLASILAGELAPIDLGDASGMNLLDLNSRHWNEQALETCGPELAKKLGQPKPADTIVSDVSAYFAEKYGVNAAAKVMAWSGDNPNSLIGLGLTQEGDMALSLGTSDVLFTLMKNLPRTEMGEGHVFYTPKDDYMGLLCFSNGSLAREKTKDRFNLDWEEFEQAVERSPVGNGGGMMLPWYIPEIVPKTTQPNLAVQGLIEDDPAQICRAVLEGQMLSRLIHAENLGVTPSRLKITGGASKNQSIVQIAADVFGCPIESIESTASAALGAALRAVSVMKPEKDLESLVAPFVKVVQTTNPVAENHKIYAQMKKAYQTFEQSHIK